MAELDHIVVAAGTLEAGADAVERLLGVRPSGGGRHAGAGTHNLLLGLGPDAYLEVIAPDPDAPDPATPRLFGLDETERRERFAARPGLLTWVAKVAALEPLVARLGPQRSGPVREMTRGGLKWRFAGPPPRTDFDGLLPSLIEWEGPSAAGRIPDSGCRLVGFEGEHPDLDALRAALRERGADEALTPRRSPHPRLVARLTRPDGTAVVLAGD